MSYATTEKELLAIVFALEKFRTYLLGYKTTVYTNHTEIRYLLKKKESKSSLMQQVLLLKEFDLEIKGRKSVDNTVADHLSQIPKRSFMMKSGQPKSSPMSSQWQSYKGRTMSHSSQTLSTTRLESYQLTTITTDGRSFYMRFGSIFGMSCTCLQSALMGLCGHAPMTSKSQTSKVLLCDRKQGTCWTH